MSDTDPTAQREEEGRQAFMQGLDIIANPYPLRPDRIEWFHGWLGAREAANIDQRARNLIATIQAAR